MTETITVLAALVVVSTLTLPVLSHVGGLSRTATSQANLATIGVAHAMYATDWNGRQVTWIVDDISIYGDDLGEAFSTYTSMHGPHPFIYLGWGSNGVTVLEWAYTMESSSTWRVATPFAFQGTGSAFGSFRAMNTRAFHTYLDGRVFSRFLYPPNDVVAYDHILPLFDLADEYVVTADQAPWGSYVMSPAAMLHPDVLRAPSEGGWQDPWLLDDGFESPGFAEALHPSLKTFVLEHHWNQESAPYDRCNPAFTSGTYGDCEPYYFNHAFASAPVTLFYDLAVRQLSNGEVLAANRAVEKQTGFGLWSRDTPLGAVGYLSQYAYDDELFLSHHILTTSGIRGRDTIEGAASPGAPDAHERHRPVDHGAFAPPIPAPGSDVRPAPG